MNASYQIEMRTFHQRKRLERYLFQIITVKYPAITPLIIAPTIIAKYIVGIIGSTFNIVVRYIDAKPVIPVAIVRSRINLFDLTYETDFDFVKSEVEKIISERLKEKPVTIRERYEKAIKSYRVIDEPFIGINFNLIPSGSWIEFRVTFPIDPKEQTLIVTEITEGILEMFNKYPDRVRFPIGRSR